MERVVYIDIDTLDIDSLNKLIDKGERFYVSSDSTPPYDDSIWETDDAFWCGGESSRFGKDSRA